MRKTSRYRVLHSEGKCWALLGRTRGAFTKAPLFPPTLRARQWYRKKLSFQQKIKRESEPRLACFHVAGRGGGGGWTPLQTQSWWASWRRQQPSRELTV